MEEAGGGVPKLAPGEAVKLPYGEKFSQDKIFVDWLLAKILRKNVHGLMIAKPCSHHTATPTSHMQFFSVKSAVIVMVSKFSVEAMVHGYHIYEDIWDPTIGEELSGALRHDYCT